ncbi:hypothetical protein C4D60_Mb07t04120 [Musa balbisiana]|uniref:Uncharacterized protein n=1 Tax=Musa balbisiana TaxID=52838 RepID=A0A4S8JFC5_MUSBA|nr:hypothetical protein C4D60_Mb07t04120 [Musa balbisiana]
MEVADPLRSSRSILICAGRQDGRFRSRVSAHRKWRAALREDQPSAVWQGLVDSNKSRMISLMWYLTSLPFFYVQGAAEDQS